MPRVVVSVAGPADYPAACHALFSHLSEPDRTNRAARALGLIASGEFDPAGLFVVRDPADSRRLVGAVLCQLTPGNAGVVWPPRSEPGADCQRVADALAQAVVDRFRAAGVKTAQTFLAPADRDAAEPLEAVGFQYVTRVDFLCRPVDPIADTTAFNPATSPLSYESVGESDPAFGELLLATYEGTLDCPELNGTRTADEVMAGYRSKEGGRRKGKGRAEQSSSPSAFPLPPFGPGWFRVRHHDETVGIVMLAPGPQADILDLSYLGLAPSARGNGFGADLVGFVIARAAALEAEWVNLSVDVRNTPARRLYDARGFRSYDVQEVFLWRPTQ